MSGLMQGEGIRRVFVPLMAALLAVMPVYVTLAEIQATPVVEPTPVVEDIPTEEVVEGPLESEAATPTLETGLTPDDQGSSMISPMSVNPIGALHDCTQNPANGDVDRGLLTNSPNVVTCQLTVRSVNDDDSAPQYGGISRPLLPSGFTAQISVEGVQGNPVLGASRQPGVLFFGFANGSDGYRSALVEITIEVGNLSPPAGSRLQEKFAFCAAQSSDGECLGEFSGEVVVTAQRPTLSLLKILELDQDFFFQCESGPLVVSAESNFQATSTCTLSNSGGILIPALVPFVLDRVGTTVTGADGWTLRLLDANGNPLASNMPPGTYEFTSQDRPTFGTEHKTYQFQIRFERTGCSGSPEANVAVYLGLRATLLDLNLGSVQYSPARLIRAYFEPSAASIDEVVIVGPTSVAVPYSLTENSGPIFRDFTIQYTVSGCGTWESYVRMGPFVKSPTGETEPVPELQTALLNSDAMQELPDGVIVTHDADINQRWEPLISGIDPGQGQVITLPFNLTYTIPAGTPVGTYISTITVTITGDEP